jgi:phosphomevalonate kinase
MVWLDSEGVVQVAKTGMGSSAALTTSLVGSLLQFFEVVDLSRKSDLDLTIVHNVAQLAHSIAQGKIGSGFDVSAAVYGKEPQSELIFAML